MRALYTLVLGVCALAQTQFEVASIHANNANDGRTSMNWGGPTFTVTGITLKGLIMQAFNLQEFQVSGGPTWMDKDRWDISAKAPDGINTKPEVFRQMLQGLLAERFHLTTHLESKEMTVLALSVAKGGAKLKQSEPGAPNSWTTGRGLLKGTNQTTTDFARMLAGQLGRQVVDKTGLTSKFDYELKWETDAAKGEGPSLFAALQEQMGLKLDSERAPVEVLLVDGADRPTDN